MRNVAFGLFLPTFWEDYGDKGVVQSIVEVAKTASALGYDSLWACDHIAVPEPHAGSARCLEPMILMAWLAQQFPDLVVGTDVLVLPQRNALVVAKQVATLSVLTGGRFILGIGAGWNEDEFRVLGADFEQRGAHTNEAVAVMKTLWQNRPASFDGDFYQFQNAYFYHPPVDDGPPVWVGGFSQAAVKRAARLGDGWMPFWGSWEPFARDVDAFRERVQQLRSSERGQALKIAANVPLRIAVEAGESPGKSAQSVQQIVTTLNAYLDAGLETVICNIQSDRLEDYLQQLHMIAEQIMPVVLARKP